MVWVVRAMLWTAKISYWLAGFTFLAGLVGFFFTTRHTGGLIVAGVSLLVLGAAKVLAVAALFVFTKLDEESQDRLDPNGDWRWHLREEDSWGF